MFLLDNLEIIEWIVLNFGTNIAGDSAPQLDNFWRSSSKGQGHRVTKTDENGDTVRDRYGGYSLPFPAAHSSYQLIFSALLYSLILFPFFSQVK